MQKKEIERKRHEREQQGKVKKCRGLKRRWSNTRGRRVNVGPAKTSRFIRNVKQPTRYIDSSDIEGFESTYKEDWAC